MSEDAKKKEFVIDGETYVLKSESPVFDSGEFMIMDPTKVIAFVMCKRGYDEAMATLDFSKIPSAPKIGVFKKTGDFFDCWIDGSQEKCKTPNGTVLSLCYKKMAERIHCAFSGSKKNNFIIFEGVDDQGNPKKDYPVVLVPSGVEEYCFLLAPRVENE